MNYNILLKGLFFLLLFSGCARETRLPPPEPAALPSQPGDVSGAKRYRVSGADSSVHILVYRGGTLASLGHNHVLSSQNVAGDIWLQSNLARSRFDLTVAVEDLVVDDNGARQAEGEDFPLNVSEEAKQGTRRNLLGAAVLDAEHFPRILIKSIEISGTPSQPQVSAALSIKGETRSIVLPVTLKQQDDQLRVSGEFAIKQSDFGIKPYSVALGALQVQDEVRIKFDLLAVPAN